MFVRSPYRIVRHPLSCEFMEELKLNVLIFILFIEKEYAFKFLKSLNYKICSELCCFKAV